MYPNNIMAPSCSYLKPLIIESEPRLKKAVQELGSSRLFYSNIDSPYTSTINGDVIPDSALADGYFVVNIATPTPSIVINSTAGLITEIIQRYGQILKGFTYPVLILNNGLEAVDVTGTAVTNSPIYDGGTLAASYVLVPEENTSTFWVQVVSIDPPTVTISRAYASEDP